MKTEEVYSVLLQRLSILLFYLLEHVTGTSHIFLVDLLEKFGRWTGLCWLWQRLSHGFTMKTKVDHCKRFPLYQLPAYLTVQVIGSTLASATLRLLFDLNNDVFSKKHDVFLGSSPSGSDLQAFGMEFIITGFLMIVVCAVTTSKILGKELEGLIIGATVTLNVIFAGEVSGASMNPARSLGPGLVWGCYKGIWIYLLAPTLGAVSVALIHQLLPPTHKADPEFSRTGSSHKRVSDLPL
ncbi:hypothetical protein Bca52824_009547 [Brassica carinata]|uniref:Uncharacterized protein n=1 Tax=Brassica carinata TaxID=52824 RepID=A0A8X7WA47_BRACI|nr:hypothetical protein Bca52824_009547 [Brassica carinata]